MKKKILAFVLVWLLLTAAMTVYAMGKLSTYDFSCLLFGKILDENSELLVDNTPDEIHFLYVKNQKVSKTISYDVVSDGKYHNPMNVFVDGEDYYVVNYYNRLGYWEDNYELCKLNFDTLTLEKLYMITEKEMMDLVDEGEVFSNVSFSVKDGEITLLLQVYDIKADTNMLYRYPCKNGKLGNRMAGGEYNGSAESICRIYDTTKGAFGIAQDGGLVLEDSGWGTDDMYYRVYPMADERFAARRLSADGFDIIDLKSKKVTSFDEGFDAAMKSADIAVNEVQDVSIYQDRVLLSCYDGQDSYIAEYENGAILRSDRIRHFGNGECAAVFVLYAVFMLMVLSIAVVLWRYVFSRYATMKMLLFIIVIVSVCDRGIYFSIEQILTAENKKSMRETLLLSAKQYESLGVTDEIEDFSNIADEDSENDNELQFIYSKLYLMLNMNSLINTEAHSEDTFFVETAFYGIDKQEDTYFNLMLGPEYTVEHTLNPTLVAAAKQAVSKGKAVHGRTYDQLGQYMCYVIYPVYNTQKEVNGFYIIYAGEEELRVRLDKITQDVIRYAGVMNFLVVISMLIATRKVLKPLRGLKRQAAQLSRGERIVKSEKLERKVSVDELDSISMHFEQMAETVQENLSEIERLRLGNRRYFSDHLLEAVHKKSIALLSFEEDEKEEYYYISVYLPEAYDSFGHFQTLMAGLCEQLEAYQAFIGDIEGRRILILSKNKRLINVMYYLQQVDEEICTVFDYAWMEICMVGAGEQYRFSCSPLNRERIVRLKQYWEQLSARLVVTQRVLPDIDANVISNCIGMVEDEYVYELLIDAQYSKKKLIAGYLQEAVGYYFLQEYEQARFLFVRVLKMDEENAAARFYMKQMEEGVDRHVEAVWD